MASRKQEALSQLLDGERNGLGEEEVALAMEGGACERAALQRRFPASSSGLSYAGPGMPGEILMWPVITLIEFFSSPSADDGSKKAATEAANKAIAQGILSGPKFDNAVWLAFGYVPSKGYKYGQIGEGVPEVRKNIVKKVWAGEPKAVAFYKAALKAGYSPRKGDPGLAQMS